MIPGDVRNGLQRVGHVVDGPSNGSQIVGVAVGQSLDDHVQALPNGGSSTGDGAASKIQRQGHRVAAWHSVGTLDSGCPLHLSGDPVWALDHMPHHWSNVWCSLCQRSGSVLEITILFCLDWSIPSCRPVVVRDVGMRNDAVRVQMICEIVTSRQVNPVRGFDQFRAISTLLDNLKHVRGTNTTSEQYLWGPKSTSSKDDTTSSGSQVDSTNMSSVISCNNIQTRCMAADSINSLNTGVQSEVEVVSAVCGDKVCCHWATTFAIGVHIFSMRVGLVLLTWNIVRCDTCPVGTGKSLLNYVEARLNV